ncbi:four-helix bundle copper-binding protein [Leptospira jelokensis]|uniref:four-helix bundle copper-binding protein n=1 Tax=Leptospira jelokensis TaxID=2484931 RepID=UPI00109148DD|nr:four-helix bundle copper-binding protein [Leptospira jelokensis]TGM06606.1 four-helix bundle copper-binding protein [Leptospira jelokensis]
MNRKELLQKAGMAVAVSGILSTLSAEDHDHSGSMPTAAKSKYAKAMMAAVHCQLSAEVCLSHCLTELGKGEKSMAACAASTREVISLCDSFVKLASQNSSFTKKLANLCIEVCESCAKECDKHANHHAVCKECRDSCLACVKELKKV